MQNIQYILQSVSEASVEASKLSNAQKIEILNEISYLLEQNIDLIIAENKKDLVKMPDTDSKKDRLLLNETRLLAIAQSVREVALLEDPTGKLLFRHTTENGLQIEKITVPLGVVGVIYESRPNVTIDVAALCIRSGNAVVLRGGSDADNSNKILVHLIKSAISKYGHNQEMVQLLPPERKYVQELLEADKYVDIIIPRGSQELINFVRKNATVPTIETGAGVCHTYVEASANLEKAAKIVVNAKTHRPSVCNALDTVLVDKAIAKTFLPMLKNGFLSFEVEIFADEESYEILKRENYPYLSLAKEENFGMEYLSQKCSIRVVDGLEEALDHIRKYSSKHSEAIVSENPIFIARFLDEVDAAAVFQNASTRFTDGGVFGLGAEIGISTQKLHARGPFALEKLTTEKWLIKGDGQIR